MSGTLEEAMVSHAIAMGENLRGASGRATGMLARRFLKTTKQRYGCLGAKYSLSQFINGSSPARTISFDAPMLRQGRHAR